MFPGDTADEDTVVRGARRSNGAGCDGLESYGTARQGVRGEMARNPGVIFANPYPRALDSLTLGAVVQENLPELAGGVNDSQACRKNCMLQCNFSIVVLFD